ncbi:MAG: PIN domain nuclease [Kineosporiaceae bacterium]
MTVLADTSAWIEYLRATGSPTHLALRSAVRAGDVVTCDPVVLEVLAGVRQDDETHRYARLLAGADHEAAVPFQDAAAGARLYRACRRAGETVRSLVDCQIAAIAIRLGVPVLHRDRDFDVLARHTPLEVTT